MSSGNRLRNLSSRGNSEHKKSLENLENDSILHLINIFSMAEPQNDGSTGTPVPMS